MIKQELLKGTAPRYQAVSILTPTWGDYLFFIRFGFFVLMHTNLRGLFNAKATLVEKQ